MLIEFSVQNYLSFNSRQTLSFLASSSTKEDFNEQNTILVDDFGIKRLLKSCAVFGANNSGKSNLMVCIGALKKIVLGSISQSDDEQRSFTIPFMIKKNHFDIPSEFEVSFICNNTLYRYGLAIRNSIIEEEWLYRTKSSRESLSRETKLFQRSFQNIEINQSSFSEAKGFVKKNKNSRTLEKTREDVPFITVLSSFNGEISRAILDWFKSLRSISGIGENTYRNFTMNLFESDQQFKSWALEILSSVQIKDINVYEIDQTLPFNRPNNDDEDLLHVIDSLQNLFEKNKIKEKKLEIVRESSESDDIIIPFTLESDGTQKLLYILGPLYQTIKTGQILLVDEFDSKFHTLLSKFIIDLYHKCSCEGGQMLLTCHDTNLLNNDTFRRDQIWFIEKNVAHESELFSLIEYKEHYTRKKVSYSKDYLNGKYGAIPLFRSAEHLKECLED